MCLKMGNACEATIENLSIDQATHQLDVRFGRYRLSQASRIRRSCSARGINGGDAPALETERALRMNVEAKKADGSLESLGYDFLQSMQAATREPLAVL